MSACIVLGGASGIVLGGFPIEGIPGPDRKAMILSSDNVKAVYSNGTLEPIEDNNMMIFVEGISAGLRLYYSILNEG